MPRQTKTKRAMKTLITFFEIPAADFNRAVNFYEQVLEMKLTRCECGDEKMAFFPDPEEGPRGAVSLAGGFNPAPGGVLVHFPCNDITASLDRVVTHGGSVVIPRTKIEVEGEGWFAVFSDSEGNRVGLHGK